MNSDRTVRRMRIAGLYYLIFIACSFAADYLASFALTDMSLVVGRMLSNGMVFRIGIVFNLLSALFFLLSAWALYELLQPYGSSLALLFLILNIVGVGVQAVSTLFLVSAGVLAGGTEFSALMGDLDPSLVLKFFVSMYDAAFMSAQLFFSAWLLPLGVLVYRSRILPRFLGVLLIVDFAGILLWFFQNLLASEAGTVSLPSLIISLAAELGLAVLLLVYRPGDRSKT